MFRLDGLHTCPYVHTHTHIQEWEVPLDPEIPDFESKAGNLRMGHPHVCHLFGSVCDNQLRILRNALVHYPALSKLQGQAITKLDAGIKNHDYQLLLEACELTFDKLFDRNCVELQDAGKCSDTLDTPFRVKHLEALLMSKYAKLIQQYEKKVHDCDTPVHVLRKTLPTCSVHCGGPREPSR